VIGADRASIEQVKGVVFKASVTLTVSGKEGEFHHPF